MPYEIKRDSRCPKSKPFGVMKKGGGEIHGCHPSRAAAGKQMATLYVAESKKETEPELEEKATEPEAAEVDVHEKMMDEPMYHPAYGATTFAELKAAREADETAHDVSNLAYDFQSLMGNRISQAMLDPEIGDKKAAMIQAVSDLASELADEVEDMPNEGMQTREADPLAEEDEATLFERFKEWLAPPAPQGSRGRRTGLGKTIAGEADAAPAQVEPNKELGFMVWKEADGSYRWMARYSNNFRDQDNPPEIISAKSHRRFDELLGKGEAPMPELWLWHRPEWKWGEATWHAYDDAGFALAAGTVNKGCEPLAEHLMALDPALVRVSHGMPTGSIVRDEQDDSVIVQHVTREISPLPAWAAANQRTGFIILKETDMAIPQDKRDALKTEWSLTDELLTGLEAANAADAKEADEAGIESKEVETVVPAVETTTVAPPSDGGVSAPATDGGVSREEMREALLAIGQAIATLSGQVKELQGQVVEVKEIKAVEEAATLSEIFQRAIGHPDTRIDGRRTAAKDRPAETQPAKSAIVNSGNPLADQIINSVVGGDFLAALRGPQQPQ